jgi:hypothetical protein
MFDLPNQARCDVKNGPKLTLEPEEKATVRDFCDQGCLQRLQVMDHQIQRTNEALQRFEIIVEALADIVVQNHPEAFQRKINELTERILRTYTGDENETVRVGRRLTIQ